MDDAGIATDDLRPRIGEVIDRLGVGPTLVKETLLGGSVWFVGGAQLIVISVTAKTISDQWELTEWQRSGTAAITFVGILLGDLGGGPITDTVGRRIPILLAYALALTCGIASTFAHGFWSLCACRILLGFAFGLQQPAWHSYCTEITPPDWRMVTNICSGTLFIVGEVYGVLLVWWSDPTLHNLNWRWLMVMASAPAAFFGMLAVYFLGESPNWLALQGETAKAKRILESIRWWNGQEQEPIDFSIPIKLNDESDLESMCKQLQVVGDRVFRYTTSVLCFSCFALNLLYYGGFYAFPFVFGDVDMGVSPALAILFGALWELPGYAATLILSAACGRRCSILIYLILTAVSIIMFIAAAERHGAIFQFILNLGFAGMKCWVNMGFSLVYQYVSEVYPTSARGVGTGICLGSGRIGSIFAPFVFEGMVKHLPWSAFFYAMVAVCVVNAVGVLLLPFETKGAILGEHVDEVREGDPLMSCHGRK
jgi:putative MFS transporter